MGYLVVTLGLWHDAISAESLSVLRLDACGRADRVQTITIGEKRGVIDLAGLRSGSTDALDLSGKGLGIAEVELISWVVGKASSLKAVNLGSVMTRGCGLAFPQARLVVERLPTHVGAGIFSRDASHC